MDKPKDARENESKPKRRKIDNNAGPSSRPAVVDERMKSRTGFYFSKVAGIEDSWNSESIALDIKDILSIDMGTFEESVQFNYMVDIHWLMAQYPVKIRHKPVLVVTGEKGNDWASFNEVHSKFQDIKFSKVKIRDPFGTHHTKLMLLKYKDGLRIVIHTANLIEQDWSQKTQGIYLSPLFPTAEKPPSNEFQADFVNYLKYYNLPELKKWILLLEECDMSTMKYHLVASVPGTFKTQEMYNWGHLKLRQVYPSVADVQRSLEGYLAGCSLPYNFKTATKQPYLKRFLYRWKSDSHGRTRASPHVKSYASFAGNGDPAWVLLTSANLSKAAWGVFQKDNAQFMIRSYELGLLSILSEQDPTAHATFLPYDVPLTPYSNSDEPWIVDKKYSEKDSQGRTWP